MDSGEKRNTFVVRGTHCLSDTKSGVNFARARERSEELQILRANCYENFYEKLRREKQERTI